MNTQKLSNTDRVKNSIKSITGEEAWVIGVPIALIHFLGCPRKALLLAQLVYLSDKGKRTDGFVFKTYKEIYEETGITEKSCRRYYDEFKAMGFFQWDIKKAYGVPTIHFKIDMDKLSESIRTFCRNRKGHFDRMETDKLSESLTETTTKTTYTDNTLSTLSDDANEDVKSNSFNPRNLEEDEITSTYYDLPAPVDEPRPLPASFSPSVEDRLWAVKRFPKKSPEIATDSFIDYYTNGAGQAHAKTSTAWQAEWRKWMQQEHNLRGYSEEKLESEHEGIINTALNLVYGTALTSGRFFFRRDWFFAVLGKEEHHFTSEDVKECLDELVSSGYLATFFGDYYYVAKVLNNGEWKEVGTPAEMYYAWNEINDSLFELIERNPSIHRDEICRKHRDAYHSSIDKYLRAGVEAGELNLREDCYMLCNDELDEDDVREIERQLAEINQSSALT
jgi:hypothetical protein